ncbi:MAG: PilZ domain-containing protein [Treponema sp.]|jgi:hypothetical protein|nr:PilZ domain-containing protein [Treponema sp.]
MDNDNSAANSGITGKKIFFLYPSTVIQNEIAAELTQQEYEVYLVRDHSALRRVLKKFPDSLVFANLDDKLPEQEWESWIRDIQQDPATAQAGLGVLAAQLNEDLRQKYTGILKLPCGYTALNKAEPAQTAAQIVELLRTMNARGRRKYLRATSEREDLTTVNIPHNGHYFKGVIKDISVAGMSCVFIPDPDLNKNSLCKNIQVKLQSMLLKAEGVVFGSRLEGLTRIYVFIFTQRMYPETKAKIRRYIQTMLQEKMDALLR